MLPAPRPCGGAASPAGWLSPSGITKSAPVPRFRRPKHSSFCRVIVAARARSTSLQLPILDCRLYFTGQHRKNQYFFAGPHNFFAARLRCCICLQQGELRAPERGSLLAAVTCRLFSSAPPAAPFLPAAEEMGERTPPKTNGFWNSFRPITATPQKGPRRIAPAPIPAAASTCRGEMPYPTAVEQCTSAWYVGAAAISGLQAIRCTAMFGNLSRAWYAAAVFSAPQPRRKS